MLRSSGFDDGAETGATVDEDDDDDDDDDDASSSCGNGWRGDVGALFECRVRDIAAVLLVVVDGAGAIVSATSPPPSSVALNMRGDT